MAAPPELPEAALALIRRFEGWSATPYRCPAGYWTIGFGALRDAAGAPVTATTPPLDRAAGEALLARDLAAVGAAVARMVRVPLAPEAFGALVSFAYNLGPGRLRASTLLRRLNAGDRAAAAAEFPRWCMAGGRRLPGLVRRREAERLLFLSAPPAGPPPPAAPDARFTRFLRGFTAGAAGRWPVPPGPR